MKDNKVFYYTIYLIVVWSLYRVFLKFPEEIEEFVIKPVIWLVPVFLILRKNKEGIASVGVSGKNLFKSIYFALALGSIFALEAFLINYVKHSGFNFGANIGDKNMLFSIVISFATAITEEIAFRGYIYTRLKNLTQSVWMGNLITTFLWVVIHIPASIFVYRLTGGPLFSYLFLTALFGAGSAFIFEKTENIASSVFLHVLWEWPIILFR